MLVKNLFFDQGDKKNQSRPTSKWVIVIFFIQNQESGNGSMLVSVRVVSCHKMGSS